MPGIVARPYVTKDASELLKLMEDLARFENFIEIFAVTEEHLIINRQKNHPEFEAFVAEGVAGGHTGIEGMAIVYKTNWHYDCKPRLVLKGLFVRESARGRGVGSVLLKAVAAYGHEHGVSKIDWVVLKGNAGAGKFYTEHGAMKDPDWDSWLLNEVAISNLAD